MKKKMPVSERAKDNSKGIVYFDPPWGQRKLPDAPAKDWSLPRLHAAAVAAHAVIAPGESGFVTAHYWQLGRCQLLAKKLASDADYRAWKIALGIPDWRLSRAIGIAKAYRTQEEAAKKTIKEAEDRVRELRADAGKKVHGPRFNLTAKVSLAEQAVTAITAKIGTVKDEKVLNVEVRRLRAIADDLAKILAKFGPKISAA